MPVPVGRLAALLVLLAFAVTAAACGSDGGIGAATAADSTAADSTEAAQEAEDEPAYSYEVKLRGLLADTLHGAADFGLVFDPKTRREYWILSLRSGTDVTSGLYLSRPDTSLPRAGTYEIAAHPQMGRSPGARSADTLRAPDRFTMIYRAGMRRAFVSQSGTLEFTTVSDTLMEGNFQVVFQGTASQPGEAPREGQLDASGSFRAEKATVGFIFGI